MPDSIYILYNHTSPLPAKTDLLWLAVLGESLLMHHILFRELRLNSFLTFPATPSKSREFVEVLCFNIPTTAIARDHVESELQRRGVDRPANHVAIGSRNGRYATATLWEQPSSASPTTLG